MRGSPSRRSRSSSPRCTRRSGGDWSCSFRTTATRATSPRPPAGSSATSASRCCRAAACAGSRGSSRRRTSSASAPRARRPRRRRARLRVGGGARRGHAARRAAAGDDRAPHGRRARAARRGPRARRVRARRARRRPRPVRRPRRARRRLPGHRPRAAADRVLRRRGRGDPRLLALHAARAAPRSRSRRLPGRRAAAATSSSRSSRPTTRTAGAPTVPDDLVPTARRRPDLVWQPDEVPASGARRGSPSSDLSGAAELDPFPRGQPHAFEAVRPAIAARGLSGGRERAARLRPRGLRVVVAFPHRGDALRTQAMLRRVEARSSSRARRCRRTPAVLFAVAPARRGFVSRDLRLVLLPTRRSSGSVRAAGTRGSAGAAVVRRPPRRRLRRPRGPRRRQAARVRDAHGRRRHARLPAARLRGEDRLYVPHEQLGKVSRYVGADAKAPALSKLGGKAWQLLKSRARSAVGSSPASLLGLYAPRCRRRGDRVRPRPRVARAARGGLPLPRDRRPAPRDRGRQGGPRVAAPDGPARLRRRRLRQDRGRRARGLRASRSTASRCSCSPRRRSSPSSTGTRSARATATSPCGSRWSPASAGRPR